MRVSIQMTVGVLFCLLLYISVRTYHEYKALKSAKESAETTAVMVRQYSSEADFVQRLQDMIREEVRALQTRERLKSEMLISKLAEQYKAVSMEQSECKTVESNTEAETSSNPQFSFRIHMNFSRLFNLF